MKISEQELPGKVGKVFGDNGVCCVWSRGRQSSGGGQTLAGLEVRRLGLALRAEWSAIGTVCPVLKGCTIKEL